MPTRPDVLPARPTRPVSVVNLQGTQRRVQVIDVPADADDELAAMASMVATLEALDPEARGRVARWAAARYGVPS
jgi:hypothetical protein